MSTIWPARWSPPGARGGGRLRLWSAACSTGEEPYSMALTLLKTAPDSAQRGARILATDLGTTAPDRADAGLYRGGARRCAARCPPSCAVISSPAARSM
uniref:CheR family methyltransferase n=1 Tax=Azospirillum agricola TaxID=1720247 RepID=UPI0037C10CBA